LNKTPGFDCSYILHADNCPPPKEDQLNYVKQTTVLDPLLIAIQHVD